MPAMIKLILELPWKAPPTLQGRRLLKGPGPCCWVSKEERDKGISEKGVFSTLRFKKGGRLR